MAARTLMDDGTVALLEGRDLDIRTLMDGFFGGNRTSPYHGSSMEFDDYREYQPGDDPRRVDWKLYGRTEELYIKLYTDERRQHHRIYIDCSASMAWGEPEKHLTALRLAAAIAYLGVSASDKVSFYAMEGGSSRRIGEPVSGRDALFLGLDALAELRCHGEARIDEAVQHSPNPGYHDGTSFLLSDFLTDSDWKAAVDFLIGRRQDVCLIQVLSRDEMEPVIGGKLLLEDTEAEAEDDPRNRRMDIGRARLLAYAKAYRWLMNDIASFCASRGVRQFTVSTDKPVSRILFDEMIQWEMVR